MKYLVVIPARSGSKGLPGKNILALGGKPLILHTVEAARAIFSDENIYVSTDSREIKDVVELSGLRIPFLRPEELATDYSTSIDVLKHALEFFKGQNNLYPEAVILLQPTSPLRNAEHLKEALKCFSDNVDLVVSVTETKSNPYYVLFEENKDGFLRKVKESKATRRQDLPVVWELNGAIYIIRTSTLLQVNRLDQIDRMVKFEMDAQSSVDIDEELDLILAESILQNRKYKNV